MNHRTISLVLLLLACHITSIAHAAGLIANVERKTVIDGESVILYIEGEDLQALPDTSALNQRFDILDSRVSNRQFRSGGKTTSTFTLRFELLAKNLGAVEIPSFESDGYISQPIVIEVVERGSPGSVPRDNVFAEVILDNSEPYVQSQVVMSLQIFDDGNLATADPVAPSIADVQVETLPVGKQRIEERDGVQYRVHTWRYALFPQKSGRIEIPRLQIVGSVKDASYGGNLILRNTPTRRISIRTKPAVLDVKVRPDESTSAWWLPVQQLELQHTWSSDIKQSRVGDPLTLSLTLTTKGATSTQLPEISLPDVSGLKMYPDVPELAAQPADDGLISQRREKWSLIPQREGTLELPAITLKWWDTIADVEREASIPAQQIIVAAAQVSEGGSGTPQSESVQADPNQPAAQSVDLAELDSQTQEPADASSTMPSTKNAWKVIAIAAIAGWVITVLSWVWRATRSTLPAPAPAANAVNPVARLRLRELKSLSQKDDLLAFRDAVMAWGEAHWSVNKPLSLSDIGGRLGNPTLQERLRQLDAAVYSNQQKKTLSMPELYSALIESLENSPQSPAASNDPLPQL